jgi:hypothetical protein
MEIYLPIAEIPVDIFSILLLGGAAGFLAGMFGIGGGFLMTPFLIFMGVNPAVAVASCTNQIIASSVSGFLAHLRRKSVDFKMGWYLLYGGFAGSIAGSLIFAALKKAGQLDLVISLCYVLFLGTIGILMGLESYKTIKRKSAGSKPLPKKERNWQDDLPWKVDFPASNNYGYWRRVFGNTSHDIYTSYANLFSYWHVTFPNDTDYGFYHVFPCLLFTYRRYYFGNFTTAGQRYWRAIWH